MSIIGRTTSACSYVYLKSAKSEGIICAGGKGAADSKYDSGVQELVLIFLISFCFVKYLRKVQFMPIHNGESTEAAYNLPSDLPLVRSDLFLINFGNGELALCKYTLILLYLKSYQSTLGKNLPDGGMSGSTFQTNIYIWDPDSEEFVDGGLSSSIDTSYFSAGLISSEYFRKKCWKYL